MSHNPVSHTPHAQPHILYDFSINNKASNTAISIFTNGFFLWPKKSTNSAIVLDIQMLHFTSTLPQGLNFKRPFLLSTILK